MNWYRRWQHKHLCRRFKMFDRVQATFWDREVYRGFIAGAPFFADGQWRICIQVAPSQYRFGEVRKVVSFKKEHENDH